MPGDALTTEENQVNRVFKNALINEDKIMDRFLICALTIGFAGYINEIKTTISEMENQISGMKAQISALESSPYPEGYSESLDGYPATDPAGPDEQPTIEQPPEDPAIRYPETKMVKIEETTDDLSDPYWRALHGWPEGEICELK